MFDTIGGPPGDTCRAVALDRRGHGRTAGTSEPFHYATLNDETITSPGTSVAWRV